MSFVNAILIDSKTQLSTPAVINTKTFEIIKLSSVIDYCTDFNPNKVGILGGYDFAELKTYHILYNNEGIYIKSAQAKKVIEQMRGEQKAQTLYELDKAMRERDLFNAELLKPENASTSCVLGSHLADKKKNKL